MKIERTNYINVNVKKFTLQRIEINRKQLKTAKEVCF